MQLSWWLSELHLLKFPQLWHIMGWLYVLLFSHPCWYLELAKHLLLQWNQISVLIRLFSTLQCVLIILFIEKKKKKTFNSIPFFFVTKENYLFHSTLFLTVQLDLPTSSSYQSFSLSDLVSFIWKMIKFREEIVWNIYLLNNFL